MMLVIKLHMVPTIQLGKSSLRSGKWENGGLCVLLFMFLFFHF